ncbi:MAG TPA: hypothetical protein VE646_14320 [Actinomycetota bacterium]|jgi:UDP-GlcNAc:undecaprenyl-phosphate GlcNAc-1-phosphate transferase|nr:hypothetical protein [Actinomycetota bacterium]
MPALIGFVLAVAITPVAAAVARRTGLVDRPVDELKIHPAPVPVIGGVAVVGAALAAWAWEGSVGGWVAGAAAAVLLAGLLDDVRSLPPWVRLVPQAIAGWMLTLGGLSIAPLGGLMGDAVLIVAAMALANAVNMVDGQDGLAGGLGAIAALGLALVLLRAGLGTTSVLTLGGALGGFLVFNLPPARVYLGDGGAYAVGILLAAGAARASEGGWSGLVAAGACLGVFAYELVASVLRRLVAGSPAARGDREHTYDRLAIRLGSRIASTAVMWVLGVLASLLGLAAAGLAPWVAAAIAAAALAMAASADTMLLPVAAFRRSHP